MRRISQPLRPTSVILPQRDLTVASPERLVGIISDTHGLLRPEAVLAMQGMSLILHAGDVGSVDVLERLGRIAPVVAVRGNIDRGQWAVRLSFSEVVPVGDALICLIHDVGNLDLDPAVAGFNAVVCGHSHRPSVEQREGVCYLNPGSAGPLRFALPATVMILRVEGTRLTPAIVQLKV